jgi:hypothetical protein
MLAGLEEISEGEILIGDRIVNNVAPKDLATPYTLQWNFNVQRELPGGNSLVEVSYLGSRGVHLPNGGGYQMNQLAPQRLSLGPRLLDKVPNPFYGIVNQGILTGPTTTVGQ